MLVELGGTTLESGLCFGLGHTDQQHLGSICSSVGLHDRLQQHKWGHSARDQHLQEHRNSRRTHRERDLHLESAILQRDRAISGNCRRPGLGLWWNQWHKFCWHWLPRTNDCLGWRNTSKECARTFRASNRALATENS